LEEAEAEDEAEGGEEEDDPGVLRYAVGDAGAEGGQDGFSLEIARCTRGACGLELLRFLEKG
jgi:hypothetical protein